MIALAALLLAVSPADHSAAEVIAAERNFARMTQTEGDWAARAALADIQAIQFSPFLGYFRYIPPRDDRVSAIDWESQQTFLSCDGSLAINAGTWEIPEHQSGQFVTAWRRQEDGSWRWLFHSRNEIDIRRPVGQEPLVRQADCNGEPPNAGQRVQYGTPPAPFGNSEDWRLSWHWTDRGEEGGLLTIRLFNGEEFETVLTQETPAPAP